MYYFGLRVSIFLYYEMKSKIFLESPAILDLSVLLGTFQGSLLKSKSLFSKKLQIHFTLTVNYAHFIFIYPPLLLFC